MFARLYVYPFQYFTLNTESFAFISADIISGTSAYCRATRSLQQA
jgi:hypothetical protein